LKLYCDKRPVVATGNGMLTPGAGLMTPLDIFYNTAQACGPDAANYLLEVGRQFGRYQAFHAQDKRKRGKEIPLCPFPRSERAELMPRKMQKAFKKEALKLDEIAAGKGIPDGWLIVLCDGDPGTPEQRGRDPAELKRKDGLDCHYELDSRERQVLVWYREFS
jgi:hypothetical protein